MSKKHSFSSTSMFFLAFNTPWGSQFEIFLRIHVFWALYDQISYQTSLRSDLASLGGGQTWKKQINFCRTELTIPLSPSKFRIDTPKGVTTARKKSSSTKKMIFRHFVIQRFSVFQILELGEIIEKIWKNKFGFEIPLSEQHRVLVPLKGW